MTLLVAASIIHYGFTNVLYSYSNVFSYAHWRVCARIQLTECDFGLALFAYHAYNRQRVAVVDVVI